MYQRVLLLLTIVTPALFALPAEAQRRGEDLYIWKSVDVDPSRSQVEIDMRDAPGAVRGLRIRTPSGRILLSNARVVYSDGQVFNERRRINLLRGERTRPINPTREDRFVDRIILFIDPETAPARSVRVQILSHQTRAGRRAARPAPRDAVAAKDDARSRDEIAAVDSRGNVLDTAAETEPNGAGRGEILFASQRIGLGLDRDAIRVRQLIGRFSRIRLRVLENNVRFKTITLVYSDGTSRPVTIDREIEAKSTTDWVATDPARFLREIRLAYEARPNFRGRARVEAFGDFADDWLGESGAARKFNEGWVLLGAGTAGFVGLDNDVVPVGRNKGGFRQIRISVRDRAITLNELKIIYADGTSDVVPVRARVTADSNWGPVDLRGNRRAIKEIQARYRSRFFDREAAGRGAAIVEIWGLY